MGESLSLHDHSEETQMPARKAKGRGANRTAGRGSIFTGRLATGLMTAITTIVVAYIAILPQLRQGNAKQTDVTATAYTLAQPATRSPVTDPYQKVKQVSGTVLTGTKKSFELYFLPTTMMSTTSSSGGSFNFPLPALPAGKYYMIIRDPATGKSSSVLLQHPQDARDLEQLQAKINYQVDELR